MYASLVPHQKKGKQLHLKDVLPFPWENQKQDTEVATLEDIEAVKQRWKQRDEKIK
jgi:hypothetical protein